ncbi:MAG: Ca2+-dependent phosphoinositide-specific phospholipase C [bacterium]
MRLRWIMPVLLGIGLGGCDPMNGHPMNADADVWPDGEVSDAELLDQGIIADEGFDGRIEALRLHHMQVRGTINSYHDTCEGCQLVELPYRHRPLFEQAAVQGIRQFDFDVFGGGGDGSLVEVARGLSAVDNRHVCRDTSLLSCLRELADFSDAHPGHLPLIILVGSTILPPDDPFPFFWHIDELEEQAVRAFGRERILTPDEVRGRHPDLATALAEEGWPPVDRVRGKVLLVLNDRGEGREEYIEFGGIGPDERYMFIIGDPAHPAPDEVIYSFQDIDGDVEALAEIERLVDERRLVHAATDDPDMVSALRMVGAHLVATGFPDEVFDPVGDAVARCNPLTAPDDCEAARFEPTWEPPAE